MQPLVEEEEAKSIVKEVQALDEGTVGTILIEPILNPLLLDPPPVVKLVAIPIQEILIEDSSGTHSSRPVISGLLAPRHPCCHPECTLGPLDVYL